MSKNIEKIETDKNAMKSIRSLGIASTVGELKELLKDYPNDTSFGFRNQPMQCLYEIKYPLVTFVVFQ